MKIVRVFAFATLLTFGFTACNQTEENTETIDLNEGQTETPSQVQEQEPVQEDDGNSIGIDVKADEDGNVDGELSGDIKFKNK